MSWSVIVIYTLIVLYLLTVLMVAFNIVLENRNPVRTLAWVAVLLFVPLVGMIFYLYFGVNYRKIKMFSMKGLGDMKWLQYMSEDQKQRVQKTEFLKKEDMKDVRKLMTLLLNNSKALLTRYNKVDILKNGEETFPAIFTALGRAKRFIHLEYYIIEAGELATRLKDILIAKAKSGVEVRVIFDDVGCWSLPKTYIREMRAPGYRFTLFCRYVFTGLPIRRIIVITVRLLSLTEKPALSEA